MAQLGGPLPAAPPCGPPDGSARSRFSEAAAAPPARSGLFGVPARPWAPQRCVSSVQGSRPGLSYPFVAWKGGRAVLDLVAGLVMRPGAVVVPLSCLASPGWPGPSHCRSCWVRGCLWGGWEFLVPMSLLLMGVSGVSSRAGRRGRAVRCCTQPAALVYHCFLPVLRRADTDTGGPKLV